MHWKQQVVESTFTKNFLKIILTETQLGVVAKNNYVVTTSITHPHRVRRKYIATIQTPFKSRLSQCSFTYFFTRVNYEDIT